MVFGRLLNLNSCLRCPVADRFEMPAPGGYLPLIIGIATGGTVRLLT
ncbi:hypothetical protein [Paenibacillus sp. RC67]|nr:hypothetical protein [Paenibacillus sp. RC67]